MKKQTPKTESDLPSFHFGTCPISETANNAFDGWKGQARCTTKVILDELIRFGLENNFKPSGRDGRFDK